MFSLFMLQFGSGDFGPKTLMRIGSSSALSSLTDTSGNSDRERLCACPPNARYNTNNPRLPPYPEPCQIKPQARLRPHNPINATTGAAAAALGVASGALEAVTTGSTAVVPPQTPQYIGYGYGTTVPHSGPCAHYPPSPNRSSPLGYGFSSRHHCQPLPVVDPIVAATPFTCPNVSGTLVAACFSPPICFLPQHPRQSNVIPEYSRDPYGKPLRTNHMRDLFSSSIV